MTKKTLSSAMRSRVTLYARAEKTENALDELEYIYEPIRTVWAEIVPVSGSVREGRSEESYVEYTHRITVRAPVKISTDMYIEYHGRRFDVLSWDPHYMYRDRIVILAREQVDRYAGNA